ncbi:uncharacterized protein IWZ02DRAFT_51196 [Phyllosticta citriasiana]|uniref:Uncharacterized protein n=1 Tax=Phyllosticta citriasiana TaxID=595635 RepID=A0ABR1KEZ9_9PEZI
MLRNRGSIPPPQGYPSLVCLVALLSQLTASVVALGDGFSIGYRFLGYMKNAGQQLLWPRKRLSQAVFSLQSKSSRHLWKASKRSSDLGLCREKANSHVMAVCKYKLCFPSMLQHVHLR